MLSFNKLKGVWVGVLMGLSVMGWANEADSVLSYVNQYRARHHLPPLQMNALLSVEAQKHSANMSTHRIPFGHVGFNDRIKRLYRVIPNANGGSENVAEGKWDARQVVAGWMNSPGHRRNILGRYNLTGIGITKDNRGHIYYTQIFILKDKNKRAVPGSQSFTSRTNRKWSIGF
jgi:uncharacterized protein YkwD